MENRFSSRPCAWFRGRNALIAGYIFGYLYGVDSGPARVIYIAGWQREQAERALFKLKIPSCYLSKFPGQLHLGLFSIAMDISAAYNFECAPPPPPPQSLLPPFRRGLLRNRDWLRSSRSFFAILRSHRRGMSADPARSFCCLFVYDSRSIMNSPLLSSIAYLLGFFNGRTFPYLSSLSLFIFRKYPEYCEAEAETVTKRERERERERERIYIYLHA